MGSSSRRQAATQRFHDVGDRLSLLPGNLRGILWMLLGGLFFTVMVTLIKLLGQSPPINQEIIDALVANPDMSSDKAREELGYSPRALRQTVEDIFTWYQEEDIIAKERARRKAG